MTTPQQYPLSFKIDRDATFDNFLTLENDAVIHAIHGVVDARSSEWIYLAGESASGVTHLLQAVVELAERQQHRVLYVDLRWIVNTAYASHDSDGTSLSSFISELFEAIETFDIVCFDHIDSIVDMPELAREIETQLFYQLTRIQLKPVNKIFFGAHNVVNEVEFLLPDLRSRLSLAAHFRLQKYSDIDKQRIIAFRSSRRGLNMPDEVARYIVERYSRDLSMLIHYVDCIDLRALADSRKLTIPFVKQVLDSL